MLLPTVPRRTGGVHAAGHGPVLLHVRAAEGQVRSLVEDEAPGFPLGLQQESYQACTPVDLSPGHLPVLRSDGLVETGRRPDVIAGPARATREFGTP
jgi:hypothetical protein